MNINILPPPRKAALTSLLKGRVRTQRLLTVLLTAFLLCNSLVAKAEDFTVDNFTYTILTDNTCSVKSTTLTSGELNIPGSVTYNDKTYTVSEIADNAFAKKTGFTSLVLNEGLEKIGKNAFAGDATSSSKFTEMGFTGELSLPSSLRSIGEKAFYYCTKFTSLKLNEGLEEVGIQAFASSYRNPMGFTGELILPSTLKKVGTSAFYQCTKFTSLKLNDGLETIGNSAFSCSANKVTVDEASVELRMGFTGTLEIPSSVKTIGNNAFSKCSELDEIIFNEGIESIGDYAFCSKPSGTSITVKLKFKCEFNMPKSLKKIGKYAFYESTGVFCNGLTVHEGVEIGANAFSRCTEMTGKLVFEGSRKTINNAFNYTGFTEVVLPKDVVTISSAAFMACYELEKTEFPATLKSIGTQAFYACNKLNGITFPEGLETIDMWAFRECYALEGNPLIIPESVKNIGGTAFEKCTGLIEVVLPNSLTTLPMIVFAFCSNLTKINVPESLKEIGAQAFWECKKLGDFTFVEGLEKIGYAAFYTCSSLTGELILPSTLKEIGSGAFLNANYNSVTLLSETPPTLKLNNGWEPWYTFPSLTIKTQFNVPEGTEDAYNEILEHSLVIIGRIM